MIDKIMLFSDDFKIGSNSPIIIKDLKKFNAKTDLEKIENEKALFQTLDNKFQFGNSAELKTDNFFLKIFNKESLKLNLFQPENNLDDMTEKDLNLKLKQLEKELKDNDIHLNLDNSKLTRLDLKKDIKVNYPVPEYGQLFDFMNISRLDNRKYPNGYLFSNKSKELCFYDKIKHLLTCKNIKLDTDILNLLRAELRLLRHKPIKTLTDLTTVKDLRQVGVIQHLDSCYKKSLKDMFFNLDKKGIKIIKGTMLNFNRTVRELEYYKNNYKRKIIDRYIMEKGTRQLVQEFGSLKLFRQALLEVGFERTYTYRAIQKVKESIRDSLYLTQANKDFSLYTAYTELENKILKNVA